MPLITDRMSDETKAYAEAGRQREGQLWSSLKDLCDLLEIENADMVAKEEVLFQHLTFKTGQHIFEAGGQFENLYIVRVGFLKTVLIDTSGLEQILRFPMKGDVLGIDGLYGAVHASGAVALSDGELIIVPYITLRALASRHSCLESAVYSMISRELVWEQARVGMLNDLSAEAKVAKFLVSIGERYEQIGYSRHTFNLRMVRRDIGSYLGLTLETISRTLSLLAEIGYITVDGRTICIHDESALQRLRRLSTSVNKSMRSAASSRSISCSGVHLI